jgi:hypothetical protein
VAVKEEMSEVGRGIGRTLFVFIASTASIIMMAVVWGDESWEGSSILYSGGSGSPGRQLFEDVALVSCPRAAPWKRWYKRGLRRPRRHSSQRGHSSPGACAFDWLLLQGTPLSVFSPASVGRVSIP